MRFTLEELQWLESGIEMVQGCGGYGLSLSEVDTDRLLTECGYVRGSVDAWRTRWPEKAKMFDERKDKHEARVVRLQRLLTRLSRTIDRRPE